MLKMLLMDVMDMSLLEIACGLVSLKCHVFYSRRIQWC